METRSQTTIERPPLNSPAQILDDYIFQAATTYASTNQSPASTDIEDQQLHEWHQFFFRVFQNNLWYYKYFLSYGAQNAQNLIDVIQTLLHVEWVNVQFKGILEIALLRFAQTYKLYPKSLLLSDLLHNRLPAYRDRAVRGTYNERAVSIKISASRSESLAFRQSILIWTRLRHENVLPVYGMCMIARLDDLGQYDGVGLVSPFMNNGSVINFLKEKKIAYRQNFILDVARGMSYLHDNGIVHGRMHRNNILIMNTNPPRACLADFGRAPVLPVDTRATPFLAPELDVPGPQYPPRTKPSDVYAFSTAAYEILTSSEISWIPWSNPSKPDDGGIEEHTWQILLDSWQGGPDQRPTAARIVERLEEIIHPRKLRIEQLKSDLNDIFNDREYYRQLLSCAKADAQEVLNIFQLLLDTSKLRLEDRNQLVVAMRRLSGRTELYPSRFILNCPLPMPEQDPIALGGFADVYKVRVNPPDHDICVKVIRATVSSLPSQEHMAKVYAREVINWGQLSHPNILPFYGLSKLGPRLCLVSRWANNGNLTVYLENNPKANRILLCLDTAAGVEYLHENNIVHGDLKGLNVLIDDSGRACLGDFGLSSVTDPQILKWTSQSTEASSGGTARWRAPEILNPNDDQEHNTKESDVFAWASTCYEAFTGRWPFYEISKDLRAMHAIANGRTPARPQEDDPAWSQHHLNDRIWKLMEDCWSFVPSERPKMTDIISRLDIHKPIDSRPPSDWEEGASMRFRMAHSDDKEIPKDLSRLWDRLGDLLTRIVPAAFDR